MAKLPDTVPPAAQHLLDFIMGYEAPSGFDTIFGNRQHKLAVPLTKMTLSDVIDAQKNWGNKRWVKENWGYSTASSASGAYQFMHATLLGMCKEIPGIRGDILFDANLQKRFGYYLLLRRGFADFISGKLSIWAFGLNLAKEWASFPVLAATEGQHQKVKRGQSFYAGDELNKALVSPDRVEARLRTIFEMDRSSAQAASRVEPSTPVQAALQVDVDPENLDKPLVKSKTVWQWILTPIGAAAAAFGGLDWRAQLLIIVVISTFAIYAIKRRGDLAKVVRELKSEISGDA